MKTDLRSLLTWAADHLRQYRYATADIIGIDSPMRPAELHAAIQAALETKPTKGKPTTVETADTSTMSNTELFAHYKRTAPLEDVKFFARTVRDLAYLGLAAQVDQLQDETQNGLARSEVYRRLKNLQDDWRQRTNRQEFDAKRAAGWVFDQITSRWIDPSEAIVLTVESEGETA